MLPHVLPVGRDFPTFLHLTGSGGHAARISTFVMKDIQQRIEP
jgi:hypothetical protein